MKDGKSTPNASQQAIHITNPAPNALDATYRNLMKFQFLRAASMKMTAIWDVASCTLAEIGRRFRDAYYHHHQGDQSKNVG